MIKVEIIGWQGSDAQTVEEIVAGYLSKSTLGYVDEIDLFVDPSLRVRNVEGIPIYFLCVSGNEPGKVLEVADYLTGTGYSVRSELRIIESH
jgi:hypothetical protein